MTGISVNGRRIDTASAPYFIADVGANHDGDLERAHRLVELAAAAGADAVKFQNFRADRIVSRRGFAELGGSMAHQATWDRPVVDVYEDASLPLSWTPELAAHCRELGVDYFTTPYDLEVVDAVSPHVPVFKIGSGDVTWTQLLRHVARQGKPVLLATGASDQVDVDRALATVRAETDQVVLMQCNTNYSGGAGNLDHVNVGVLARWRIRYPELVLGLSDHTQGHTAVCAAVAVGARVFEKHFTDDTARPGPDHGFAMTPDTWRAMVEAASATHRAMGDGTKRVEPNEREAAVVQRRALRFRGDLPAGHRIGPADVVATRPCPVGGLPPHRLEAVLGRDLAAAVTNDALVTEELLA